MLKTYCLYKKGSKTELVAMAYGSLKNVKEVSKDHVEGDWCAYKTSECGKYLYAETETQLSCDPAIFRKEEKEKVFEKSNVDWSGRKRDS